MSLGVCPGRQKPGRRCGRSLPGPADHLVQGVWPRTSGQLAQGRHRIGDGTELCVIQFVGNEEGPEIGGRPSNRRRIADRRTAYAAKLRKEAPAEAATATSEEPPADAPADSGDE